MKQEILDILKKYKADSTYEALKTIILVMENSEHYADFHELSKENGIDIHQKDSIYGKTPLNFAIESLCNYVIEVADLNPNTIQLKLIIICNLILNNARLEQLDIASTNRVMEDFKTTSQSLMERKLANHAQIDSPKECLEGNLTKREYEYIFAYIILKDLVDMAKYFADLVAEGSILKTADVKTYAKPIILFESHVDPSVLDFFRHLNYDFKANNYKILYEKNYKSTLLELISWLESNQAKRTVKNQIALERLRFFAEHNTDLIFYDPRLAEHQAWKTIHERYSWLFKAADWDKYYEPISPLVDQCMALNAIKHIISNQGRIILIAGSGHYKQLMMHLAPYRPNAFMIRTSARESAEHEQLALNNSEVRPLVLSVDDKVRERDLNEFKTQYVKTQPHSSNYPLFSLTMWHKYMTDRISLVEVFTAGVAAGIVVAATVHFGSRYTNRS